MTLTTQNFHTIARQLNLNTQAYIDGSFTDAIDGKTLESLNPATETIITRFAHCNTNDVDKAVKAARKAFKNGSWSNASPEHRKAVLLTLADLVEQHATELAVIESIDSGKTISDSLHEIGTEAPAYFRWYAELADKAFGKVAPTDHSALALIVKEPAGVAGAIVPWNFPFLMAVWKMAPALAAGCSIVIKPAEQTTLSLLKFAELLETAGVPAGVVNIVPGLGETAGKAIGLHSDIDVVSFTGSTSVGRMFMRYSGDSNLKNVALEMGGKSPFIVLDDANITDDLIEHAAMAAFWNGGQNCSANMRQLIAKSRKEEFLERLSKRVNAFKLGDPLDPETTIGSMITQAHKDKVMSYIHQGQKDGAQMTLGGDAEMRGFYVKPTIFDHVTPNMSIARQEIFGPVLGIIPIDSMEEAINIANDSDYGLHATVFTRDLNRAITMGRQLACGTISINGFSEGDIKTPFGGYKQSGSAARDNGTEGLEQYLLTKTIWIATE